MAEACYEISNGDLKSVRERLRTEPGVLSAESSGATLHVFADKDSGYEGAGAGRRR